MRRISARSWLCVRCFNPWFVRQPPAPARGWPAHVELGVRWRLPAERSRPRGHEPFPLNPTHFWRWERLARVGQLQAKLVTAKSLAGRERRRFMEGAPDPPLSTPLVTPLPPPAARTVLPKRLGPSSASSVVEVRCRGFSERDLPPPSRSFWDLSRFLPPELDRASSSFSLLLWLLLLLRASLASSGSAGAGCTFLRRRRRRSKPAQQPHPRSWICGRRLEA